MSFEIQQQLFLARPAMERLDQGRQQEIVHLSPVGSRRLPQQGFRLFPTELDVTGLRRDFRPFSRRIIKRQRTMRRPVLFGPEIQLTQEYPGFSQGLCRFGPLFDRCGLRRNNQGTPLLRQIGPLKVLQEKAPRHPVDHEMVGDQQEPDGPVRPEIEQHRPK